MMPERIRLHQGSILDFLCVQKKSKISTLTQPDASTRDTEMKVAGLD